jgi:two-component system, NtrC family, sensor kinase
MKGHMSILRKFFPDFSVFRAATKDKAKYLVNFPRLWRSSVLMTAGVALIPLVAITIVDYDVTQRSIESELLLRAARTVSNTRRAISFFLFERKSSLDFIVHDNSFEQLNDPKRLAIILENLRQAFGDFTDLGVIDDTGRQTNYVGPYELKDKVYSDQEWYKQVLNRNVHISDVFLGYRKVPHLVIAVKRNLGNGSFFILRAALDIAPFRNLLFDLELDGSGDAFIINNQGILQTPSRYHGDVLQEAHVRVPAFSSQTEVFEDTNPTGEKLLIGYRYIEDTPFILIISKKKRELMEAWQETRLELIVFLAVSVILILAVILNRATYMVNKLYLTDEKRVAALHQAEYANKMASIGRLASGVAHEINNPLAIINEKAGLIKDLFSFNDKYSCDDKLMGLVDSVLASVKRCARITSRLLRFARHMDVSREIVKLEDVVYDVLGFLEKEAAHRSIQLTVEVQDVLPFETDRGKLQQIFLNVVNNAFSAMDEGGHLKITARDDNNGYISVTIDDDGCGIPQEDIDHIFEPFFSTKTGQGGTGLGLSITYGLVQELGGSITVQSEVGAGTSFTIRLPLQLEQKGDLKDEGVTRGR